MSDLQETMVRQAWRSVPAEAPREEVADDPWDRPLRPKHKSPFVQSLLGITVVFVFCITFVVQAFRVPSSSMENTLLAGDFMLADKFHFADNDGAWGRLLPYRSIRRGDIVVFRNPVELPQYVVKRVIGLPGDRLRLQNKVVYINGKPLRESYAVHEAAYDAYRDSFPAPNSRDLSNNIDSQWRTEMRRYVAGDELVVPQGKYFVMGDNRDRSLDSRYWGFVPRSNILGRPLVIYLSVRGWGDNTSAVSDDKLFPSGQMLAHFFQLARWDRTFRLVR
jgi:signal peptidase I